MIDAEVTIEVSVMCDQCKSSESETEYPDPWGFVRMDSAIEAIIDGFTDDGWEIEDEAALCPECVAAREDDIPPPEPYRDNGGIHPMDGVGLKLFDA
jgi:hypothetical protein